MPIVNVYHPDAQKEIIPADVTARLKEYIARELTCGDMALNPADISVRFLGVRGEMIGAVEIDIFAKHFPDRVQRQDEICRNVATFIKKEVPSAGEPYVWLILSELGHSV